MKKFYSLITILAIFGLTASAAKPTSIAELTGEWMGTFYAFTTSGGASTKSLFTITEGEKENEIKIYGLGLYGVSGALVASVDFDASTISIDPQIFGIYEAGSGNQTQTFDAVIEHMLWIDDHEDTVELDTPFVATIGDNTITFNVDDIFRLVGYYEGEEAGQIGIFDSLSLTKQVPDPTDTYTPLEGKAEFQDGWMLTCYENVVPSEHIYEVAIEQSDKNPNIYRLVDPYANKELYYDNISTTPGYIVFDITDPEFVMVKTCVYSGFEDIYYGKYYFYNYEAYVAEYLAPNTPLEEIKEIIKKNGLTSTYKDGIVELTNCIFGYTEFAFAGYSWTGTMKARIALPGYSLSGVKDVAIDNNAPVEYYNLQGIKVENPESGLYIRRQGNETSKVFIR